MDRDSTGDSGRLIVDQLSNEDPGSVMKAFEEPNTNSDRLWYISDPMPGNIPFTVTLPLPVNVPSPLPLPLPAIPIPIPPQSILSSNSESAPHSISVVPGPVTVTSALAVPDTPLSHQGFDILLQADELRIKAKVGLSRGSKGDIAGVGGESTSGNDSVDGIPQGNTQEVRKYAHSKDHTILMG